MPFQMLFLYLALFLLVIAAGIYTYPVSSRGNDKNMGQSGRGAKGGADT